MRIGFDFRPALKKNSRRRGIGRYTHELCSALLDLNEEMDFVLYSLRGEPRPLPGAFEIREMAFLRTPSRANWILDWLLLPGKISDDRLDIFHATELTSVPRNCTAQVWVTVHDLIPLLFWEQMVKGVPRDYRFALRTAWRRLDHADRIITDSLHSKKDICERLGISEDRVEVVYLGCSAHLSPIEKRAAARYLSRTYAIDGPFLFYVGGTDFRKNLEYLVRSFAQLRQEGYPGRLVLGGETFLWRIPEVVVLKELVRCLGLESVVTFPGYIPDEELSYFYSACDFFVFPSLYEGFGLPVMEACKCGAAALVSRVSSLPEVAGDAVLYFDPSDPEGMVAAFWANSGNSEVLRLLQRRGIERAKRFTWSAAARRVMELYRNAI